MIVWDFATYGYDIAFTMKFNGIPIANRKRYASHQKLISGSFTSLDQGKCTLIWDNKYSKLRSKELLFRAAVLTLLDAANCYAEVIRKQAFQLAQFVEQYVTISKQK